MSVFGKIKSFFGGAKEDPVTAGHDWKGKPAEEVSEADRVRSQEEMKETFGAPSAGRHEQVREGGELPDGSATAVYEEVANDPGTRRGRDEGVRQAAEGGDDGGMRGEVELPSGDVHSGVGTDDNRASPSMQDIDRAALASLAEDEVGDAMPREGLGLDDGPTVGRPTDIGRR